MAYPEYVPTRAVSIGGAMVLESSALVKVVVGVKSSKSLIWADTGYRFESMERVETSETGSEAAILLPRTDVQGWRDAKTGELIDVSADGSFTHRYVLRLTFADELGRTLQLGSYTIGPFTVPEGDGPLDLDKTIPVGTVSGDVVSIPDMWSAIFEETKIEAEEAKAAALEAAGAVIDSASFVANEVESGPAAAVVSAKIQQVGGETFGAIEKMPDNDRKAVGKGELMLNVLDFGAWGDGSHSTQNVTAFQGAIDAALAQGKRVFVPAGYYVFNNTLSIIGNVEIFGANQRSTTLALGNGTNKNLFEVAANVVGFNISDLSLFGNKNNNTAGSGIKFLDEATSAYRGTGRLSRLAATSFAENGIHLGKQRSTCYLDWVTAGANNGYGIFFGQDSQDNLVYNVNVGTNLLGGASINGSNSVFIGGTIYGSDNLLILESRASKTLLTGTVMEASNKDAIVVNIGAGDDVNTVELNSCSFGRIGLTDPSTYSLIKSTTAARIGISGHVYKKTSDTAPSHIFDIPAACEVNMMGLLVQEGAFATALSKNGTQRFQGQGAQEVVTPASRLASLGSTPTLSHVGGVVAVMSMPNASSNFTGAEIEVPSWWKTFEVIVRGVNLGAGTGNVSLRLTSAFAVGGDNLNALASLSSGSTVTTAALAQYVAQDISLGTRTNTPGKRFAMRVDRRIDGSDTLANAYGVESIVLVRRT